MYLRSPINLNLAFISVSHFKGHCPRCSTSSKLGHTKLGEERALILRVRCRHCSVRWCVRWRRKSVRRSFLCLVLARRPDRQAYTHSDVRGGGRERGEGNAGSGGAKTSLPRVLDLPQKSITHWSCKCSVGCTFLTYLHLFLTIFLNINGGK